MASLPEGYAAFPRDKFMSNARKIGLSILLVLVFPFVTLLLALFSLCILSMVSEIGGIGWINSSVIVYSIIEFVFYVLVLFYLSIYIWILIKIWWKQAVIHRQKIFGILGLYAIAAAAVLWYL